MLLCFFLQKYMQVPVVSRVLRVMVYARAVLIVRGSQLTPLQHIQLVLDQPIANTFVLPIRVVNTVREVVHVPCVITQGYAIKMVVRRQVAVAAVAADRRRRLPQLP